MSAASAGPVVGVVGLGHIGGSVARAVLARGGRVVATTRSAGVRSAASAEGVEVVGGVAEVIAAADVVVLAVPLPALAAAVDAVAIGLEEVADARSRPTVTDVGSVKGPVAAHAEAVFGNSSPFVPGHPMAGTERAGWDSGDPRLFEGRRWALAIDPPVDLHCWATVARLVIGLGAEVVPVSAAAHDRAVALVSHLPYALASDLAAQLDDDPDAALARSLAAGSFADATRVAGGHPDLGAEMALANRAALAARLTTTGEHLLALGRVLGGSGPAEAEVRDAFEAGARGRAALDASRAGSGEGVEPAAVEIVCDRLSLIRLGLEGGRVVDVGDVGDGVDGDGDRVTVSVVGPSGTQPR